MLIIKELKSHLLVLKYFNFTEFALLSEEFRNIVLRYYDDINQENIDELSKTILGEISALTKEKGKCAHSLIKSEKVFNIYKHIYPHGKSNPNFCEKLIVLGSDSTWDRMKTIEAAMLLMGEDYIEWKNKSYSFSFSDEFFSGSKRPNPKVKALSLLKVRFAEKSISKKIDFCIVCH